jgi:hypothetical protein
MGGAKRAVKYLDPKLVVKATFQGKRDARSRAETVLLTVGTPNYVERKFIGDAKKAGEPFPIKKIQLKHAAAKKKGTRKK